MIPDREPWMEDANCVTSDAEIFFPDKGGSTKDAKLVCSNCDVRNDCLSFALDRDDHGVWGGLSQFERRRLKRGAA